MIFLFSILLWEGLERTVLDVNVRSEKFKNTYGSENAFIWNTEIPTEIEFINFLIVERMHIVIKNKILTYTLSITNLEYDIYIIYNNNHKSAKYFYSVDVADIMTELYHNLLKGRLAS